MFQLRQAKSRLSPFAFGFVKCALVFVLDLARIKEVGILGERLSLKKKVILLGHLGAWPTHGPTEHFIYNQKNNIYTIIIIIIIA